jgi:hypothetical protein
VNRESRCPVWEKLALAAIPGDDPECPEKKIPFIE